MRGLKRNKRSFSYALLAGKVPLTDTDGNYTGEHVLAYDKAVSLKANISPASGRASVEMFGTSEDYDRVILTDDMSCPIDENTILWINKTVDQPAALDALLPADALLPDSELYPKAANTYAYENYNYVVRHVAKGLYSIAYAVAKVDDHVG